MQGNLRRNITVFFFTKKDVKPGIQHEIHVGQAETQYLEILHCLKDAQRTGKHIDLKEVADLDQRRRKHII